MDRCLIGYQSSIVKGVYPEPITDDVKPVGQAEGKKIKTNPLKDKLVNIIFQLCTIRIIYEAFDNCSEIVIDTQVLELL